MIKLLAALLMATAPKADYRSQYPLPGLTVPDGWGVCANLASLTDEDMDSMKALGVRWVRTDLQWSRVEQKAGVYNFSKYDPVIDGLRQRGIRAMLILDYGNKVYDVDAPRTREGRTAFAAFAARAVEHYRHEGILWEIWNEPNLSHFWRGEPSVAEYAALVKVVVPAIRNVSSDEWIVGPASSRFDWPFLEGCFKEGLLDDFDAVTIHPYRDKSAPDTVTDDWAKLRAMLDQYSPKKTIPMLCSEWGYSTYPGGVSQQTQGQYAVRQYLTNLSAGVPMTLLYSWKSRADASSEKEQNFGVVEANGTPKQAYNMIQDAWAKLAGYQFDSEVDLGDPLDRALVFRKGADRKVALWTAGQSGKDVRLPVSVGMFATGLRNRLAHLSGDVQVLGGGS